MADRFRQQLLDRLGTPFGVLATSGTLAIFLALRALDIRAGDEVIVPDFTFFASASSVVMTGAVPVLVDVNRRNFQIDLTDADRLVSERTKAVIPVHMYGTVADMAEVEAFASRHGLAVVEDAAQALGVRRDGQAAGTFGTLGCFSFFADKSVTTGEGGLVVTSDQNAHERLVYLRNQGRTKSGTFVHPEIGFNCRTTDLQAAIGIVQLQKLDEVMRRKRRILKGYREGLADTKVVFLEPDPGADWVPFRVAVLHHEAPRLAEFLRQREIETRPFFTPLHRQPALARAARATNGDDEFPNSVFGWRNGICLPAFPTMTEAQLQHVCQSIVSFPS